MSIIGNILWLILGGIIIFLEYVIGGALLCLTIIGIPFGIQCFKLAALALLPFGREVIPGPSRIGCVSVVFNLLWLFTFGLLITLSHVVHAGLCALTIIGIPFAIQHMKLARLAFTPFGFTIT